MIDERYQTGGALTILGTVATWINDNPTDFVTMIVAVLGFIIMLYKYFDERQERKERIKNLQIERALLERKLSKHDEP